MRSVRRRLHRPSATIKAFSRLLTQKERPPSRAASLFSSALDLLAHHARTRRLRIQPLGGDLGGRSRSALRILVLVLHLSPYTLGVGGLAFALIKVAELNLCEVGRHGRSVALAQLLKQLLGVGVAAHLLVQSSECG